MQTFGRMRLDVENCVRELVDVRRRRRGRRRPARRATRAAQPDERRRPRSARQFLERRATVSHEDRSPSVQRFREMIGRDEKMLVVFEWIRTAAKSDISVLILGPTGSGKEVVARMIHELSRRGTEQVPGRQLRGAARHAVRIGNLRLREGRVHRRARSQAGPPRAGQQRHAVPRRDRRPVAHRAGQAAARARGAALRAARRQHVDRGELPADLGDQPAARSVRPRRALPRGSLLPRQRVLDPAAVAARAASRHPGARAALPRALLRRATACRSTARRSRRKRSDLLMQYHWPGNIRELESTVSRAALSSPGRVDPRQPTSSSCTPARRRPTTPRERLPSLADAERAHIVRVLESVQLEQEAGGRACSKSAAARSIARSWNTASRATSGRRKQSASGGTN